MQFPGLTQSLVDILRKKIIIGELEPGQKINEIELSKSMNISRSPLREAFRILENEHLVIYIPRKGNSVSNISINDLSEIYQIREMIECFAIDLIEKNEIQIHDKLNFCIDHMNHLKVPSQSAPPEEKLHYVETLAEFHLELVKVAGNKRLFDSYVTIHSNINRYVFLYIFTHGVSEHGVDDHVEIIKYLKQKKYNDARHAVKDHVRQSCHNLFANGRNLMKNNFENLVIQS